MSAFCVFGASFKVAREKAEKKVSTHKDGRDLTEAEWVAEVEQEAARIFDRMAPVRVSPEFDAPSFCGDFIALARRTAGGAVARLRIMQIGEKRDKSGNVRINAKSGKPVIGWVPRETNT